MLQLAGAVDVRAPSTAAAVAGRSVAVVGGGMTAAALALAAARLDAARVVLLARAALVVQEFECEVRRSGPPGRRDEHGTAAAPSVAIMHLPLMLRHSRPDLSESRFDLPSVQVLCMCAFVAPGRTRPQRALVRAFLPAHFHAAACQVGWYGSKRLAAYARPTRARGCARRAARGRRRVSMCRPRRRCRCLGACLSLCGSAEWLHELWRGCQMLFKVHPVCMPASLSGQASRMA